MQDLLETLGKEQLRKIVEEGPLGARLQAAFFGRKFHKTAKTELVRGFVKASRALEGRELAASLLGAWQAANPQVAVASRATLGRDDPFAGPTTEEFFERLSGVVSNQALAVLRE